MRRRPRQAASGTPTPGRRTARNRAHRPASHRAAAGAKLDAQLAGALGDICAAVRQRTGHDFAGYKVGTLQRRIHRRLQALHLRSVGDYLHLLETDPGEPERLVKDLLIGVTQFFRDPEAFQALSRLVIPRLGEGKAPDAPVRLWVAGCASGEEAYSIAMLLREHLDGVREKRPVQIFATDLDRDLLAEARLGRYPPEIAEHVAPERLARFFVREGDGFRASEELRETCIFSQHSLIRDPPFSQLDLVSCRNVLIYLSAELQKKLGPLLHHALRPGGFLFLGPSEGLAGSPELFEMVDKKSRILRRKETLVRPLVQFPLSVPSAGRRVPAPGAPRDGQQAALDGLEDELRDTRAELRTTVEGLESANEELESSNEELVSTNEELQTANEELQTSREALQTVNEELETVNDELLRKLDELATANGDLQNLFAATQVATVFLDRDLRVKRFTPAASGLLGLVEADVDRRFSDLAAPLWEGQDLSADAGQVLRTSAALERQVRAADGRWFILRVLPYRTLENVVSGAVVTLVDISAVKRAEEATRQQVQLVQLSHDAIVVRRFDGTIEVWNHGAELLYGYAPQEAVGRTTHQLLGTLFPKPLNEIEDDLQRTGTWAGELEHRTRDGRRVTVLTSMQLATGEDGVVRILEANRDITARKRAEESLRLSEEKFARAFHGNTAGMAITRLRDGVFVDVNDRWEEMSGFSRADAVDRSATELSIWKRPEDRKAFVTRLLHAGVVQNEEYRFVRRGGEEWTGLVSAQITTLGGEQAIVSSLLDVSERRRAEEVLRESEARFRAVFENSTDAILMGEPEGGRILAANPAASRLFGYTEEEFRSLPRFAIFDPDDPGLAVLLRARAEAGHATAEIACRRKDGTSFTGELSSAAFLDGEGRRRAVASIRDVTSRKAAEEALREADRRRTEFLAVLSHELRNPLAPIRNSLYVLDRAAPEGDQARRARSVIGRQVDQLARLVDDLLDVTRITRGKVQLQLQRLELNDLLRHAVEDHRSLFERDELHCQVEATPDPVFVQADWNRLAQVVGNLLSNAAKFTPHGGSVIVSLATEPAAQKAVIRVSDTGVGMAPQLVERLFEPFMQADTTLDRSQGGLGLGLALVKGLVELHGGSVSGTSDGPGKGALFTVRLPLDPSAADARPPPRAAGGNVQRRVLVIEDNVDAAESLREVLGLAQHLVEVAYGGVEGVEKARSFRPEVVLCDIGLPGIDGYEVARAFRADPALREVHLVALTGYAQPEDVARAREAGFDAHLAKPPSLQELEEILERAPAGKGKEPERC